MTLTHHSHDNSHDHSQLLLSCERLTIGYGGVQIVPPLSFELHAGLVTSIVGHNGSGKSTLLKTLLKLSEPISGQIRFAKHSRIGYVPQRESMDPIYPVRVAELVETGRYGERGVGRRLLAEDHEKVYAALAATNAAHLKDRLFRTLSGGEQQRILLARALCVEPNLLILDEPTASMDEKGAKEAMDLTLKLARERNAAILMVNHFIDLVARISDQVIYLSRDQQEVKVGTPKEIFNHREAHL